MVGYLLQQWESNYCVDYDTIVSYKIFSFVLDMLLCFLVYVL